MNLAQYRLQAAVKQRNRLQLCLAVAGILHIGAIALIYFQTPRSNPSNLIQFVAIDQPDSLDASSSLHASVNSSALPAQPTRQVASPLTGIPRSSLLLSAPLSTPQTKTPPQVRSISQLATQKDEVWGTYLATLRQQIYQHWQATLPTQTDRPAKVRFMIDRRGRLTDLEIIQSSRDVAADRDAVKAVHTAVPFAPLPKESKEERLRVTLTFEGSDRSQ